MGRFGTRWEATQWMRSGGGPSSPPHRDSEGPSSPPQHIDSDGNPLSPLLWPDDGTVPPWRRRAGGTELPESPERRYTAAEIAATLPPGFLDPLPPHLRYPYRRHEPEPQPEPQPEPESEPEEEEPEEEDPEEAEPEEEPD